jgi:polyferredoxin
MFSKADIEKYFLAEKQESLLFLVTGIIAIILALVFFFGLKTNFYKGAAVPLVAIGLLMGIAGYTVHARSDADRKRNVYAFDMNPGDIREKEIPRMEKVMKNFIIYRYAEIILILLGATLFFYFKNDELKTFWKGVGLTLAILAAVALSADYFAEKRGLEYLKGLNSWVGALK